MQQLGCVIGSISGTEIAPKRLMCREEGVQLRLDEWFFVNSWPRVDLHVLMLPIALLVCVYAHALEEAYCYSSLEKVLLTMQGYSMYPGMHTILCKGIEEYSIILLN